MDTAVQLPEALADRLKTLAQAEGIQLDSLIRRLISEYEIRDQAMSGYQPVRRGDINFPLIPQEATGVIMPVTGAYLDEMFAFDSLAPGR